MKYPNHILLDVKTKSTNSTLQAWSIKYTNKFSNLANLQPSSISSVISDNYALNAATTGGVIKSTHNSVSNNLLWDVFTIHFVRKEFIYTKLKYSRCPEQDIVSGGVAAIFSGFLGFLICEKFGLELLDSGDFYTFFMYTVFLVFSVRPLLRVISSYSNLWHCISLKLLYTFLRDLLILLILTFRIYFSKVMGGLFKLAFPIKQFLFNLQFISNIYHFWRRVITFLKNTPKKGYETFKQVK